MFAERVGLRHATEIEAVFIVGGRKYARETQGAHECDAKRPERVILRSPICDSGCGQVVALDTESPASFDDLLVLGLAIALLVGRHCITSPRRRYNQPPISVGGGGVADVWSQCKFIPPS